MEYLEIDLADLSEGQSGLLLFASDGFLVGCIVERQPGGDLRKSEAARCDTGDFIRLMSGLFAMAGDNTCRVIIDRGGYWPNQFPHIRRMSREHRVGG